MALWQHKFSLWLTLGNRKWDYDKHLLILQFHINFLWEDYYIVCWWWEVCSQRLPVAPLHFHGLLPNGDSKFIIGPHNGILNFAMATATALFY